MLEQTENLPILSFSPEPGLRAHRGEVPRRRHPGDVFFHNDVFTLGNQNNDVAAFKPIFVDGGSSPGRRAKGHQADIGGAVRGGYNPNATEVWQEALRIPAVKVYERGELPRGRVGPDLRQHPPAIVQEDMRAEIGACTVGERRLLDLMEKYGLECFEAHKEHLFEATRKMMEAEIRHPQRGLLAARPRSTSTARTPARPTQIRVKITVEDERITFDYSDTDRRPTASSTAPTPRARRPPS